MIFIEKIVNQSTKHLNLFFDENVRATGLEYYGLGDWSNSPNNQLLAFSEDVVGRRKYTIRIRKNNNSKLLKDVITNIFIETNHL